MNEKKIAVMIYPFFSLQEITCLTSALTIWRGRKLDVFAASKDPIRSEDGFSVTADKLFSEFNAEEYDCVILPGILDPLPALFEKGNIEFLRGLADKDIIIAAISSAPLLLAKAGLLEDREFTSAVWDEILQYLDFVPKDNIARVPVCKDGNIITAVGFAFREFAVAVLRALCMDCGDNIFPSAKKEYTAEELTFKMGKKDFAEFFKEYRRYETL